ncbi:MAG: hypothetical protein C4332_08790 [Meiothermus sp.]
MSDNKAIFRRHVDEVLNQGDLAAIGQLFAPDFVGHVQLLPAPTMSREDVKQLFAMYRSAFSGFDATLERLGIRSSAS